MKKEWKRKQNTKLIPFFPVLQHFNWRSFAKIGLELALKYISTGCTTTTHHWRAHANSVFFALFLEWKETYDCLTCYRIHYNFGFHFRVHHYHHVLSFQFLLLLLLRLFTSCISTFNSERQLNLAHIFAFFFVHRLSVPIFFASFDWLFSLLTHKSTW